jgi:hypothetical protein
MAAAAQLGRSYRFALTWMLLQLLQGAAMVASAGCAQGLALFHLSSVRSFALDRSHGADDMTGGKASGWTVARWSQPTPARLNSLEPASTVSGPKPRFCWRWRLSLSACPRQRQRGTVRPGWARRSGSGERVHLPSFSMLPICRRSDTRRPVRPPLFLLNRPAPASPLPRPHPHPQPMRKR